MFTPVRCSVNCRVVTDFGPTQVLFKASWLWRKRYLRLLGIKATIMNGLEDSWESIRHCLSGDSICVTVLRLKHLWYDNDVHPVCALDALTSTFLCCVYTTHVLILLHCVSVFSRIACRLIQTVAVLSSLLTWVKWVKWPVWPLLMAGVQDLLEWLLYYLFTVVFILQGVSARGMPWCRLLASFVSPLSGIPSALARLP